MATLPQIRTTASLLRHASVQVYVWLDNISLHVNLEKPDMWRYAVNQFRDDGTICTLAEFVDIKGALLFMKTAQMGPFSAKQVEGQKNYGPTGMLDLEASLGHCPECYDDGIVLAPIPDEPGAFQNIPCPTCGNPEHDITEKEHLRTRALHHASCQCRSCVQTPASKLLCTEARPCRLCRNKEAAKVAEALTP